jgi:pyruvate dehydrogenase E2 component (dihydrolipoamide acetyltransferase)
MSDVALHRLGGDGPDLLFIHGFGADRLSWLAVAPQLFDLASVWAVE